MRLAVLCTALFGALAGVAHAAPDLSTNWAGYAAVSTDPATPLGFSNITGTWVEPKGTCTAGRSSSAAFWVGLGGYDETSTALEQLGTSMDCDGSSAKPVHSAWWELVPAAAVKIPLKVFAGDTITAAVVVKGQTITFFLKNVTRKTRFTKVVATAQELDTTSAEWIAEAPSLCTSFNRCRVVPLTNFGTVTFQKIAATANDHPGTLTDPFWAATPIELITNGSGSLFFGGGDVLGDGVGAVPSGTTADGRGFSVSWAQNLTPPG